MHQLVRIFINLGHDRTNSVILAFLLFHSNTHYQIFNSKLFYSKFTFQNSKMTRTKKTLGHNWTRYHNYYGMNNVLEAACTKQLHWDRETLRDYTLTHSPEVNHQSVQSILPLCQATTTMPGFRAIRNYQVAVRLHKSSRNPRPRRQRRRARRHKEVGRCCQLPSRVSQNPEDTNRAQWPYERFGAIKNQLSCSSESCHSSDW